MYSRGVSTTPSYADTLAVLDRVGRALADGTRRRILTRLLDGPAYPADLAAGPGREPVATVSNHLACLRGCGLVSPAREGRQVRYELADRPPRRRTARRSARLALSRAGTARTTSGPSR